MGTKCAAFCTLSTVIVLVGIPVWSHRSLFLIDALGNLEKYILPFGQINSAIWTNTFYQLDKYTLVVAIVQPSPILVTLQSSTCSQTDHSTWSSPNLAWSRNILDWKLENQNSGNEHWGKMLAVPIFSIYFQFKATLLFKNALKSTRRCASKNSKTCKTV